MKKFLLGAAAVMAVAAPGAAAAQSGYVGGIYANQDVDTLQEDSEAWGAEGSVFFNAGSLGIELDAQVLDNDATDATSALTGHLFTRNESYLFGGFASYADNDVASAWSIGLEANKYFDRWTLNGSVGYGESEDSDAESLGVDVGLSMFATDNLRIDAAIGYADAEAGGADDTLMSFGAGGELGFGPVSLGLAWSHFESDDSNGDADTVSATVRFNFGSESLFDRDRNGASQANRTALGSLLQAN